MATATSLRVKQKNVGASRGFVTILLIVWFSFVEGPFKFSSSVLEKFPDVSRHYILTLPRNIVSRSLSSKRQEHVVESMVKHITGT